MSKEKHTKEQIDFVRDLVEKGSKVTRAAREMCAHFNLVFDDDTHGRIMRKKMQKLGVTNNVAKIEDTDVFKEAQQKEHDSTKKRFLISWAQSDTPVHKKFLKNMEAYAEAIDAQILICAGRYKNPNSLEASEAIKNKEKNKKNSWDKLVLPYLDANRHNLHKYLQVLSDVKVQPTASTPLSGMNSISGEESCIIGHPRVQLQSLPVIEGYPHKLLLTTGACTHPNYTDTKVGKKSEFHHQIAFCIVELDGEDFHVRQVVADKKGDFYDLIYCVKNGEVSQCGEGVPALVFGDLHLYEEDKIAVGSSFRMASILKPNRIFIHDLANGHSVSHHEQRDPFILLDREEDGSWSLQKELDNIVDWFKKYPEFNFISVQSNHNEFIDRWLRSEDWRKTKNKKLYLEFANVTANGLAPKGIIAYYLQDKVDNLYSLGLDESYNVLGFELGMHSHVGVHGSKSSPIQLKNLPVKSVVGHSHVPHRYDGSLCVGTLTKLRVGYNRGPSGWLHSNVVIYPNGKASHINIINGKFTTLI
jgi:hypothetical protein